MENLNKLSFYKEKVNEESIYLPMDKIVQEFDTKEFIKPYLLRVLFISKYSSKNNTITCYLAPKKDSDLPIMKAELPFDLISFDRLTSNTSYTDEDIYLIKEKIFSLITKINLGKRYYLLCFGYLVNTYKDIDANTRKVEGYQSFSISSNTTKKLKITSSNYQVYYFNSSLTKLISIYFKTLNKKVSSDDIKKYANSIEFKKFPANFLIRKGGKTKK